MPKASLMDLRVKKTKDLAATVNELKTELMVRSRCCCCCAGGRVARRAAAVQRTTGGTSAARRA